MTALRSSQTGLSARCAGRPGLRHLVVTFFLAIALLVLTACGGTAAPAEPAPSTTQSTATEPNETPAVERTDPRSITGPSHVEVTEFIEPVADNPTQNYPVSFIDETGQTVEIVDGSRVLLLDIYGTYTDIAIGLGLEDVLVGRTSSDTQDVIADLPVVTQNGHELSPEAILNLAPSLVITDTTLGPPEVIEQLRATGITVVELSPDRSLDTIDTTITTLATVLGVPAKGEQLATTAVADIEAAVAEIAQMAPTDPMRAIVLYIRGTAGVFFIFGAEMGTGELLTGLGMADIATENGITEMRPANAEALAQLDPELIIVMTKGLDSTGGIEGLLDRPGVAQTTAGAKQRVVDIADGQMLSFGPNTGNVLRALAEAVYPE